MQEFHLVDEKRQPIPIMEGFPKEYLKNEFPGAAKFHAVHNDLVLLFQIIKVGPYEIADSEYLTNIKVKNRDKDKDKDKTPLKNKDKDKGKLGARANGPSLELHFLLTGQVQIHLKGLNWTLLVEGSHNITTVPAVKSEVYFKELPVATFDLHFLEESFAVIVRKYPKLAPLLAVYRTKKEKSFFRNRELTNPLILHLILQIKLALKAGLENEPSTLEMVEKLIYLVLEDELVVPKFHYNYNDIERIHEAHRLIGMYLEEKNILQNKMQQAAMPPAKFREGFKLLFGRLPSQYLHDKRMERAHKLATDDPTNKVDYIANLCGFDSSRHLSKAFFKTYGIKLSEILHRNRKKGN